MTITRKQYMADPAALHDDYYLQFVTPATRNAVGLRFGADRIGKALAKDQHLNNIPIAEWDRLSFTETGDRKFTALLPVNREEIRSAGETVTRAVLVCIAKAAARALAVDGAALEAA